MAIKQISVFLENRHGALSEVTTILKNENIDIRALSIADTTDYGILRMIVSDTEKAKNAIKGAGITVHATEVLGIKVPDVPGGFSKVVDALGSKKIDIEYTYAFLTPKEKEACVIVRVDDNEEAIEALKSVGIDILKETELFY
ncbi:MAG: ACT domain-containing protein [Clostridia bacterium]|nr:ACT domain-containing protein [Clostridia bacterium]